MPLSSCANISSNSQGTLSRYLNFVVSTIVTYGIKTAYPMVYCEDWITVLPEPLVRHKSFINIDMMID